MRPAATYRAKVTFAALLWLVFVVGLSVGALTVPVYTSALTQALGVPGSAGLSAADVVKLTGQVRAFGRGRGVRPASVRRGADVPRSTRPRSLTCADVRAVMSGARIATGIVALLLALHVGWCVARRRSRHLRSGMVWGAGAVTALVALAGLAGLLDFSSLFAAFHGLFFAQGTWTFPYDSLLIRLFPERFWSVSAAVWAGLSLLGAGVARARGTAASGDGWSRIRFTNGQQCVNSCMGDAFPDASIVGSTPAGVIRDLRISRTTRRWAPAWQPRKVTA